MEVYFDDCEDMSFDDSLAMIMQLSGGHSARVADIGAVCPESQASLQLALM